MIGFMYVLQRVAQQAVSVTPGTHVEFTHQQMHSFILKNTLKFTLKCT